MKITANAFSKGITILCSQKMTHFEKFQISESTIHKLQITEAGIAAISFINGIGKKPF